MSIQDQVAQTKSELARVDDRVDDLQDKLAHAKAEKQALLASLADLQGYLDWKKTQP